MCFCDKTNHVQCFDFQTKSSGCSWNTCSHREKRVQTNDKCPTNFLRVCEPCTFGTMCQFTTRGYVMSLDAILGSHIRTAKPNNIFHQTRVIKISVVILSLLVIIGSILNIFAIGAFRQSSTHKVGCGLY